jgi:DNA-binding response OmpR family regulator
MLFLTDGHAVDMARDAAQGMQLLEREHYDLIIADPGTPAGSGSRFGDELVARWPALRRRTIFATADVRPETEAWLSSLKCRYLHKPLSAGQLRAAAAELLGLRSGG